MPRHDAVLTRSRHARDLWQVEIEGLPDALGHVAGRTVEEARRCAADHLALVLDEPRTEVIVHLRGGDQAARAALDEHQAAIIAGSEPLLDVGVVRARHRRGEYR
ncbi:hypothetical protein GTY65_39750 [Streptomyces sp. SID8379]|uniref:hypothetical protein n=1 Tax=unclassified Streptomyces TaxID=2593676 RepID=UPI0003733049|nr:MULTISPECIES: hypothetical protein [unclassified Streptomyces]MYW70145.1 hypothetical protein [Streptomyces sp. SID8379]